MTLVLNEQIVSNDLEPLNVSFSNPNTCGACHLQRENYILLTERGYWKKQHEKATQRLMELEEELKESRAKINYLNQQLYGRKTEKKSKPCEKNKGNAENKKGHQPGAPGHPRRNYDSLPEKEELYKLDDSKSNCPRCGLPFKELIETEDSEIIEVAVKAHKRKIKKKKYTPACQCNAVPGIITAPGPPKLIPKSRIGISIWTLILLEKYQFGHPIYRIINKMAVYGISIAVGTIGDGLKKIKDIFNPVYDAIVQRSLTALWWQGDETRWLVKELIGKKLTYRWYLWVFITAETVVYIMDPTRATVVIERYLGTIINGILLVDRYSAYKSFVKNRTGFILAFCWSHVRRDFINAGNKYPELKEWVREWKEHIGNLFHLNKKRLEYPLGSGEFEKANLELKEAVVGFKRTYEEELQKPKQHVECKSILKSLHNHWAGLIVFVDHPHIPMDNNESERKVRNAAMGRKNYYGSGCIWSAHFTAKLFSIFQTLLKWEINIHDWLLSYLTACAHNNGLPPDDISAFLPWNIQKIMEMNTK